MAKAQATPSRAKALTAETLPTPDQMKEFWKQLQAGKITPQRMQDFLRPATGLGLPDRCIPRLSFWDSLNSQIEQWKRLFPNHWPAVAEVVLRSMDPWNSLGLQLFRHQEASVLPKMISWRSVPRVVPLSRSQFLSESPEFILETILNDDLIENFDHQLMRWLRDSQRGFFLRYANQCLCPHHSIHEEGLYKEIGFDLDFALFHRLNQGFEKKVLEFTPVVLTSSGDGPWLGTFLQELVGVLVVYCGVLAGLGRAEPRLGAFLNLINRGNWPIGFGPDGELYILCSSVE